MTTMILDCELSSYEQLVRARELAAGVGARAARDEERKAAAAAHREALAALDAEIARLAGAVATGREPRPVPVTERRDYQRNVVEVVRSDTGEVVTYRAMGGHERQMQLAVLPGGAADPAAADPVAG